MKGINFNVGHSSRVILAVIFVGACASACADLLSTENAWPITVTILMVCITLFLLWQNEDWSHFGLQRVYWPATLLFQVILILVLSALASVIALNLFLIVGLEPPTYSRFEGLERNIPMTIKWLTIGWVVGGFFEEVIFRGFLLNYFERSLYGTFADTQLAIVLQALLFGLLHYQGEGMNAGLTMFLAGIVAGEFYVRFRRDLWPVILSHGMLESLALSKHLLAW